MLTYFITGAYAMSEMRREEAGARQTCSRVAQRYCDVEDIDALIIDVA